MLSLKDRMHNATTHNKWSGLCPVLSLTSQTGRGEHEELCLGDNMGSVSGGGKKLGQFDKTMEGGEIICDSHNIICLTNTPLIYIL